MKRGIKINRNRYLQANFEGWKTSGGFLRINFIISTWGEKIPLKKFYIPVWPIRKPFSL